MPGNKKNNKKKNKKNNKKNKGNNNGNNNNNNENDFNNKVETTLKNMIKRNQYKELREYVNNNNIIFKNLSPECFKFVEEATLSKKYIEETKNVIFSRYDEESYHICEAIEESNLSKLIDYLSQHDTSLFEFKEGHAINIINYAMVNHASYEIIEYLLDCFPIGFSSEYEYMYDTGFYDALIYNRFDIADLFLDKGLELDSENRVYFLACLCKFNKINPENFKYLQEFNLSSRDVSKALCHNSTMDDHLIIVEMVKNNQFEVLKIIFENYYFKTSKLLRCLQDTFFKNYKRPSKELKKALLESINESINESIDDLIDELFNEHYSIVL